VFLLIRLRDKHRLSLAKYEIFWWGIARALLLLALIYQLLYLLFTRCIREVFHVCRCNVVELYLLDYLLPLGPNNPSELNGLGVFSHANVALELSLVAIGNLEYVRGIRPSQVTKNVNSGVRALDGINGSVPPM